MPLYNNDHENIARELDRENREKKSTARGAQHRVNGCKSRKCSLPSDSLTPAQIRALNGPVETFDPRKPVSWETFKQLSEDLQRECIRHFRANHGASDRMLAEMFGVSSTSVLLMRNKLGVPGMDKGYRPGKGTLAAWREFIHSEDVEDVVPEEEPVAVEESPVDPVPVDHGEDTEDPKPVQKRTVVLPDSMNVSFSNVASWEELYALLKAFPAPGGDGCRINIFVQNARGWPPEV